MAKKGKKKESQQSFIAILFHTNSTPYGMDSLALLHNFSRNQLQMPIKVHPNNICTRSCLSSPCFLLSPNLIPIAGSRLLVLLVGRFCSLDIDD
jgi:hypothetical protein